MAEGERALLCCLAALCEQIGVVAQARVYHRGWCALPELWESLKQFTKCCRWMRKEQIVVSGLNLPCLVTG